MSEFTLYSTIAIFKQGGDTVTIELQTSYGRVDISNDVVATVAGGAAIDCYGIIGMASKSQIRDGIAEILRRENFSRGVVVRQEHGNIHIDMYIIVSYGIKISEVSSNVQAKVKYVLNQTLGVSAKTVNIYIQGVRVTT